MEPHMAGELMRRASASLLRSQSDGRLVELARGGSDEAFEAIVARYRRPLLRYCTSFLPPDEAEDTVQEALTGAYRALVRGGDAEILLRPWLYRIAHNASVTTLRQRAPSHELLSEDHDGVETPEHAVERSERLRDVVASVNSLPDQQRSAIVLRALEGRSYEDIAAELGMSRGAAHQLVHRARLKLRAAAAALLPPALVSRLPWGSASQSGADRAAELGTAGGATAVAVKVCATVLVAGAVVGGAVEGPRLGVGHGSGASSGGHGGSGLEAGVVAGPGLARGGSHGATDRDASHPTSDGASREGVSSGPGSAHGGSRSEPGGGSGGSGDGGSAFGGPGSGGGSHLESTAGAGAGSADGRGSSGSSGSGSGSSGSGGGVSGSDSSGSGSGRDGRGSGDLSDSSRSGSGSSGRDEGSGSGEKSAETEQLKPKDGSESDDG